MGSHAERKCAIVQTLNNDLFMFQNLVHKNYTTAIENTHPTTFKHIS
jgi:hypothetical protein